MTERFDRILRRYGETVQLISGGGEKEILAFIQPVTDEGREAPYQVTSLGTVDDRKWVYLGMEAVEPGDGLRCAAGNFTVSNSAAIYAGREFSHWWAALETEKEAAQ